MVIGALDPGTTSGFVVWEGDLGVDSGDIHKGIIECGELCDDWKEHVRYICEDWWLDVLVVEDFVLRGGGHSSDRHGLDPVRIISGLELMWRGGRLVLSDPSRKAVVTNERLKLWGLYVAGSEHIRDAFRHLVVFLRDGG